MNTLIITGGTGGLGSAVTKKLIENGYNCVVPYRNEKEAQDLRASLAPDKRDQLLLMEADLMKDESAEHIVEASMHHGDVYGLVHLLGGFKPPAPIAEYEVRDWDFMMNLNLRSYYIFSRLVMQKLQERGEGRIIGIAAMQALKPGAKHGAYGVSKAGVVALTKILADEGREFGVTANAIAPSVIKTDANMEWGSEEDAKNWVTPAEIADTIAWLLSAEARSVNGSVVQAFGKMGL
jgi:NAD(P)-dependent dehydrogenase (short-subunit alcohol dehydrogenase family)